MVVILGHRRQRNFERVFFFLCLALLFFFGASLLALNTRLYYSKPPEAITLFSWILVCAGLWLLPSSLLHLNAEYAAVRGELAKAAKRGWILAAYAPAVLLAPSLAARRTAGAYAARIQPRLAALASSPRTAAYSAFRCSSEDGKNQRPAQTRIHENSVIASGGFE